MACVIVNRISVPGERSTMMSQSGICIGAAAMTTRGLRETEFELIVDIIHEGLQIFIEVKRLALQTSTYWRIVFSTNLSLSLKMICSGELKVLLLIIQLLGSNPYTGSECRAIGHMRNTSKT